MGNRDQKPTSFKTIENRVKNLNPQYMVPVDEASQVISDPQTRKKTQPVTEQPLSGPPPPGSRFNPIYMEPRSVSIDSTRDLQVLFPNSSDCIGDMKGKYNIDRPHCPSSPTRKMESSHQVQGDREGASGDGLARNHHQAD